MRNLKMWTVTLDGRLMSTPVKKVKRGQYEILEDSFLGFAGDIAQEDDFHSPDAIRVIRYAKSRLLTTINSELESIQNIQNCINRLNHQEHEIQDNS